jgi:DNA modification methylase
MNIELHNGDCLEVMKNMPDKSVDCIITDPPYELSNHGYGKTELSNRKIVKDKHIDFISN